MSIFIDNAKYLLNQTQDLDPAIKHAYDELSTVSKEAGILDLIHNPKFQNIINLLTPFVVNYKVNQVLKLLKDLERENKWWM